MKYSVSPYYEYRQEISSKTIVLIGVFLVITTLALTIYSMVLINRLELDEDIGSLAQKMKIHLASDTYSILNVMALILSSVSIIIGFISILRSQNIGWLLMLISMVCFILNS